MIDHSLVTTEFRKLRRDHQLPRYPTARRISPRVTVSVVYVLAMFTAIMDTTIVNIALPTISRDLSVPLDRVDGVVVGFLVSLAVFIPASGWLGDRFGTRRVFLAALAMFTAASALCGLAGSFGNWSAQARRVHPASGPLPAGYVQVRWRATPIRQRAWPLRLNVTPCG